MEEISTAKRLAEIYQHRGEKTQPGEERNVSCQVKLKEKERKHASVSTGDSLRARDVKLQTRHAVKPTQPLK